eukprot:2441178-Lingulodinium_polyedra.AAC.1
MDAVDVFGNRHPSDARPAVQPSGWPNQKQWALLTKPGTTRRTPAWRWSAQLDSSPELKPMSKSPRAPPAPPGPPCPRQQQRLTTHSRLCQTTWTRN